MQAVIDIGNTQVKVALFNEREFHSLDRFAHEEYEAILAFLRNSDSEQAIISSSADESFKIFVPEEMPVLHLSMDTPLPISLEYEGDSLGQDRIANAVGLFAHDAEAGLVIDMGTCITYNHLRGDGFIGGSISPGLRMRLKAMHTFTGRLPLIEEIERVDLITTNTTDALLSGAIHGIRMEIDGQLGAFYEQYADGVAYLTGGDSLMFADTLKNPIFADPLLTLRGLNEILLHQKG